MIPPIIHYCWFGRTPLPELALKCIESWKKYFPNYEIKEWNEDNFDVNIIPYTAEAYKLKKYAFVSDYARFWILYHYGGIYFDTDVEVIRPMDDIIVRGPFMGCENMRPISIDVAVNPGLGIAANKGMEIYTKLLERYSLLNFLNEDGTINKKTIVEYTTDLLYDYGLKKVNEIQVICDCLIYPYDYFCPKSSIDRQLTITKNTRSIHHYDASWIKKKTRIRIFEFLFGYERTERIRMFFIRLKKNLKNAI